MAQLARLTFEKAAAYRKRTPKAPSRKSSPRAKCRSIPHGAWTTAGGPFLAGMLRDVTGSYAVPWLVAAVMLSAAMPLTLAVGLKPTTPDARSSKWVED